jgi:hypothetical protein
MAVVDPSIRPVRLGAAGTPVLPIALGGSTYEKTTADADILASMDVA